MKFCLLPVTRLGTFDSICSKYNFYTSWDASSGKFCLNLLYSNFLKVNKPRFVHIENKSRPVVALSKEIKLISINKPTLRSYMVRQLTTGFLQMEG